ncbi:unnamed protein product [Leptosia nina]|uniref:Uncharacterized protein n=1 Tax=Leptosia nina TaxID=320188 RepID=A0AAV1ISC6_9NEOP
MRGIFDQLIHCNDRVRLKKVKNDGKRTHVFVAISQLPKKRVRIERRTSDEGNIRGALRGYSTASIMYPSSSCRRLRFPLQKALRFPKLSLDPSDGGGTWKMNMGTTKLDIR